MTSPFTSIELMNSSAIVHSVVVPRSWICAELTSFDPIVLSVISELSIEVPKLVNVVLIV